MAKGESGPCFHCRSRCVKLLPSWDPQKWQVSSVLSQIIASLSKVGIHKYLSLAGGKRLVMFVPQEGRKFLWSYFQIPVLPITVGVTLG